jgi:hypothetical protein
MCGRYGKRADKQRIAEAMRVNPNNIFQDDLPPSYNVGPETYQPIVRLSRDSGERELAISRNLRESCGRIGKLQALRVTPGLITDATCGRPVSPVNLRLPPKHCL